MKYGKNGNFVTDCELVRNNTDGTIDIKYTDLFDGVIEKTVDIEDVQWEMTDIFDHVIEVKTAEKYVVFKEPIKVGFFPREEFPNMKDFSGNEMFEKHYFIHYEYDFGMCDEIGFKEGGNFLDITTEMSDEEIVRRIVEFDLAHAFDHPSEDPNYNHTHWALYGNLKDRLQEVLEPEFDEE